MLGEYKVNRCTRQCASQGRPLRPGEWYYSVVLPSGDDYIRRDYSAESWTQPPEEAVGWWKNRMPSSDQRKLVPAPPEILVEVLRTMTAPEKAKSRYLLALMLMRRRIVRPLPSTSEEPTLKLVVIADGSELEIPSCEITRGESESLREELNELLYCEADPESGSDESGSDESGPSPLS